MKRLFLTISTSIVVIFAPSQARATGVPVVDVAAIAQLIEQVSNMLTMIDQLETLTGYADLDHEGLATQKFRLFLRKYKEQFDSIMREIEGYQNMFAQIERLDEVYFPYHTDWDKKAENENDALDGPGEGLTEEEEMARKLKKQVLWTRIQMKHAAKVGAAVRETLDDTQDELELHLQDNKESAGALLALQIGNEITGTVGKSLQVLNTQMNEYLQAYSARNLEENHTRGLRMRRLDDVMKGYGEREDSAPAPLNPIGAYAK